MSDLLLDKRTFALKVWNEYATVCLDGVVRCLHYDNGTVLTPFSVKDVPDADLVRLVQLGEKLRSESATWPLFQEKLRAEMAKSRTEVA